jgi:hypothetical protein
MTKSHRPKLDLDDARLLVNMGAGTLAQIGHLIHVAATQLRDQGQPDYEGPLRELELAQGVVAQWMDVYEELMDRAGGAA